MLTMAPETVQRRLFRSFATILEYPRPGLAETARECEALLVEDNPEAAALLRQFRDVAEEVPLGRLEEIYTGTFDLNTSCFPYAGYHLFGESYKRSVFLLGLKERYQAHGFAVEGELPDHLAVLLRFLATTDDAELGRELIEEALLPVLPRLLGEGPEAEASDEDQEPPERSESIEVYRRVLRALRLTLQQPRFAGAVPSSTSRAG